MYIVRGYMPNESKWHVVATVDSYPTAEKIMIAAVEAGFTEIYYDKVESNLPARLPVDPITPEE